jgi:hypothetical protein
VSTQVSGGVDAALGATAPPLGPPAQRQGEGARPPDVTGPARPDHPWWRSALVAFATWAAAAGTYIVVTLLSWMIDDTQGPPLSRMYEYWNRWDTGHYIRIAQEGYSPDRPDTQAFFPLYPILIRAFDVILPGPTLVAALVVSNLACFGALVVLHRFAAFEFDPGTADRTVLFLMAFPTAFFLCAGYNESLFLLLSTASLYCMRRGQWWVAAAHGAHAGATPMAGVLLVIAFVAEYVRQRGWRPRWDAVAVALVPAGLAAFSAYCWVRLHDPLAFSHAQGEWGRELTPPWSGVVQAIDTIDDYPLLRQVAIHNFIDVVSVLLTATLLLECLLGPWLRRDLLPLVLYSVASFLVVLTGPVAGDFPLQGAARYALEFVPMFFLLARFGAARAFERIYLLPAVGLQVVFLLTFINNVWVA